MSKEHLSVEILEESVSHLSGKLSKIKKLLHVDTGQEKAPAKRDYKNAILAIQRVIES